MTIGAAISNALSGLGANGRAAKTVSSNVSNALTPGYGVRETSLSSSRFGGVEVSGIQRMTDPRLVADRRVAEADLGVSTLRASVLTRAGRAIGEAGEPGSLSGRVAALGSALNEAAATPDNDVRLDTAVSRAADLATGLRNASKSIQAERTAADTAISDAVDTLNTALSQIDGLNEKIRVNSAKGSDISSYLDQRQNAIDDVSRFVPVREIPRKGGSVMLISQNGQVLLDAKPTEISFQRSPVVTADRSVEGGLSTLQVGNREIGDMTRPDGPMSGGKLAELFALRDETLPDMQQKLDGFAKDLVVRFTARDEAGDLKTFDTGRETSLFVDSKGGASEEAGLAGRIEIFSSPDGSQDLADEPWRLRDGFDAPARGDEGRSTHLTALASALDAKTSASSSALGASRRDAGGQADAVQSTMGSLIHEAERGEARNQASFQTVREAELSQGVDTDAEIQNLLLIEQAYGANARVMEVANSLLQRLLEI